ncbi:hypothetical protein [Streptomyces sp. NPDC054784]
MMTLTWTAAVLAIAGVGRLLATAVALLARDPAHRADAREVLRLLLVHRLPTRPLPPEQQNPAGAADADEPVRNDGAASQ